MTPARSLRLLVASRVRVLAFPVALLVADLILRLRTRGNSNPHHWSRQDWGVYVLGALWAMAAWPLFVDLLNRLGRRNPRGRRGLAFLVALTLGALYMAGFGYRAYFDQSPSWQVLKFVFSEMDFAWQAIRWTMSPVHYIALVAIAGLCLVSIGPKAPPLQLPSSWVARLAVALGGLAYAALSVFTLGVPGFQDPLPPEANTTASVVQLALASLSRERHLVAPVRPAILPQADRPRANLLFLLQESLRADAVFPDLGYLTSLRARDISPFGSTISSRRTEGYFVFPRARSNSTATESSVPSILSGIDPGGDTDAYGHATTVWAVGKATGASTFLYSAQAYSFSHFDEYFFDSSLDVQRTGTEISPVVVNFGGIDDGLAVEGALAEMKRVSQAGRRFMGVIHFNATHWPGYPGPGVHYQERDRDDPEQYANAARYVDRLLERTLRSLTDLGLDQTTILVSTSDHGEPIHPHHPTERLNNFYEETVRVPFWIRVPPRMLLEHPEWQSHLDSWRDRNVQNLDIIPTIWDLLETDPQAGGKLFVGRSLLQPIPPGPDLILGQSTCAWRDWTRDGFFAVNGMVKFILSNDQTEPQIYDLGADPSEQRNLWSDPTWRAEVIQWAAPATLAGQERTGACRRMKALCPFRLDG